MKKVEPDQEKQSQTEGSDSSSENEDSKTKARRRILAAMTFGGSAALIPTAWQRPSLDAVTLPAHAQTTPDGEEPEPEPEPECVAVCGLNVSGPFEGTCGGGSANFEFIATVSECCEGPVRLSVEGESGAEAASQLFPGPGTVSDGVRTIEGSFCVNAQAIQTLLCQDVTIRAFWSDCGCEASTTAAAPCEEP